MSDTYRFDIPMYLYAFIVKLSEDRGCSVSDAVRYVVGIPTRGGGLWQRSRLLRSTRGDTNDEDVYERYD